MTQCEVGECDVRCNNGEGGEKEEWKTRVIVTAPLLFAIEEFPQLHEVVQRGFDHPADANLALDYLGRSQGIQRTKELALKHANLAAEAIAKLPDNDDEDVIRSRRALVDLTEIVIKRI
ncbi:Solanesyl-diphosphate synthase 1 mitochondrial [Bienertia sinuspersici]